MSGPSQVYVTQFLANVVCFSISPVFIVLSLSLSLSPSDHLFVIMDTSLMACLLVSDYTLNTASYVALSAGTKGVTLPIDQYVVLNKGILEAHDDFVRVCADETLTDYILQELKKIAENLLN